MGFWSDVKADGDKCESCGASLYEHGIREETVVLPTLDQDGVSVRTEFIPVKCGKCSHVNPIPYMDTGEVWTFADTVALSAHPEIYNQIYGGKS